MSNNLKVSENFHLGVYGILLKNRSILLVKKSRGPYMGKLDLPGGKPEHGESPKQTLAREILEETGVRAHACKLFDNYSTVAGLTHHMGMIYLILSYDDTLLAQAMEAEDSLGAQWYELDDLTEDMLSPFAYEIVKKF